MLSGAYKSIKQWALGKPSAPKSGRSCSIGFNYRVMTGKF